jgi:hypothetical protein
MNVVGPLTGEKDGRGGQGGHRRPLAAGVGDVDVLLAGLAEHHAEGRHPALEHLGGAGQAGNLVDRVEEQRGPNRGVVVGDDAHPVRIGEQGVLGIEQLDEKPLLVLVDGVVEAVDGEGLLGFPGRNTSTPPPAW